MNRLIHTVSILMFLLMTFVSCKEKRKLPNVNDIEFVRYNTGISFQSNVLKSEVTFSVLFPESYREDVEQRYPVVYMLHGYGEHNKDWSSWVSTIKLQETDGLQPMIYVFPNCGNSYYSNSYDGKSPYMDMFVDELVKFVDESYRTIPDRQHRAVMGYSMGGFGAMVLPLKNPEVFSISVPLSMSFRTDEQYMTEPSGGWDNQWGSIFGGKGKSGVERLTDYYKSHSPFYQFIPANKAKLSQVKWFFHCGDDEEQLLIANDNLHVQLRDYEFEHEFRIGDGGHDGEYWRNAARETLPWIEHVMKGNGEWTKLMGQLNLRSSELNEDGSFASQAYKNLETKEGLAIYVAHHGFSKDLIGKIIGFLSKSGSSYSYMILPCDLNVKSLLEWTDAYKNKYGVGRDISKSHIIAFYEAGLPVYEHRNHFSAYYYVDANLTDNEGAIIADANKFYYIDQTDDSHNYRDMNALYRACKKVVLENGKTVEADFEYRMRNGAKDMETDVLWASKSIAENLKYH